MECFVLNTWGKSKAEKISMMAMVIRLPTAVVIKNKDCSTDFMEGGAREKIQVIFRTDDIDRSPP